MIESMLACSVRRNGGKILNFFNPARLGAGITLSNLNQRATIPARATAAMGVRGYNKGKWYFELYVERLEDDGSRPLIGIGTSATPLSNYDNTNSGQVYWWYSPAYGGNVIIYRNNNRESFANNSFGKDSIIGVALDLESTVKTMRYSVNGVPLALMTLSTYVADPDATFYPFVGSPGGRSDGPSITYVVEQPHYTPAGFQLW